jgi:hypothetical protein
MSGSAGEDRGLGCTGPARGPLSAAHASALAASTLAEDALGTRPRVGRAARSAEAVVVINAEQSISFYGAAAAKLLRLPLPAEP